MTTTGSPARASCGLNGRPSSNFHPFTAKYWSVTPAICTLVTVFPSDSMFRDEPECHAHSTGVLSRATTSSASS
jgi:hypothetical protein